MNLDPSCGKHFPSLPSPNEAVDQVSEGYAEDSWGGISPEQLREIRDASDATRRISMLIDIFGSWPVNTQGDPYPVIIDPRTGDLVQPPPGNLELIPEEDRVTWTTRDRGLYIQEWYERGYEIPIGGWDIYDIHHIIPKEYGGTNDFENLVPVLREEHQQSLNRCWYFYRRRR
jgi:hypothetical protein